MRTCKLWTLLFSSNLIRYNCTSHTPLHSPPACTVKRQIHWKCVFFLSNLLVALLDVLFCCSRRSSLDAACYILRKMMPAERASLLVVRRGWKFRPYYTKMESTWTKGLVQLPRLPPPTNNASKHMICMNPRSTNEFTNFFAIAGDDRVLDQEEFHDWLTEVLDHHFLRLCTFHALEGWTHRCSNWVVR